MYSYARSTFVLLLLLQLAVSDALASNLTEGHIDGTVVASGGELMSGVAVRAENLDTGFVKQKITDARGTFRLPLLPSGEYTLHATRQGYDDVVLENVPISLGTGTDLQIVMSPSASGAALEEIVVIGSKISRIDLESSETTLTLTEAKIDLLPLARDMTSVAMLAPGTVRGDGSLGGGWGISPGYYASFGGSSVAENAYYINGMNVTNFKTRLGGSTVPFEFLQEFQVKTGGISAEFGRATGGFINAVTKRGTNEFRFGASVFYEPEGLREESPDVLSENGSPATLGSFQSRTTSEANIYASGPIVRDKLFFYALYNPRIAEQSFAANVYAETRADDAFWGAKLDYDINENHALELTAFADSYDEVHSNFNFDATTGTILDNRGDRTYAQGGTHWIAKYSGFLTQTLSLSALVGHSKVDGGVSAPGAQYPVIFDNRAPEFYTNLGSWVSVYQADDYDERDALRLDLEWELDRHLLRAGIDHESNISFERSVFSGNELWVYWDAAPGDELPSGTVPPGTTQVAQHRVERSGGKFDIKTTSWYIEDSWQVSDNLTLNIGVRNERFDNRDANGDTFIKITDQWAPRLGFAWNVLGNDSAKLYGSYGRYHLPIASITNAALAGTRFLTEDWFVLLGLNADDTPQLGPQIGETNVFANGEIRDPDSIVDTGIEPMYQDEYTLGFESELGDRYIVGINAVHRDLASVIEDITIDAALNNYAQRNGYADFSAGGFDYYILTNPGTDMEVRLDLDFDGIPETIRLTADELGYPRARRKYSGVNLFVERVGEGNWSGRIDYTWSKSYGNIEGYVRSDNGQMAAGITSLFDVAGLMDGSYGDLPNDRRHSIKAYGTWDFRPGWSASAIATWTSGKPINAFGIHPTDPLAAAYGPESFYDSSGVLIPRGSVGRTPSWRAVDLSLRYEREVLESSLLTLQLDVFNAFNMETAIDVHERSQLGSGSPDSRYGLPSLFQAPRSVRISARLEF